MSKADIQNAFQLVKDNDLAVAKKAKVLTREYQEAIRKLKEEAGVGVLQAGNVLNALIQADQAAETTLGQIRNAQQAYGVDPNEDEPAKDPAVLPVPGVPAQP